MKDIDFDAHNALNEIVNNINQESLEDPNGNGMILRLAVKEDGSYVLYTYFTPQRSQDFQTISE